MTRDSVLVSKFSRSQFKRGPTHHPIDPLSTVQGYIKRTMSMYWTGQSCFSGMRGIQYQAGGFKIVTDQCTLS